MGGFLTENKISRRLFPHRLQTCFFIYRLISKQNLRHLRDTYNKHNFKNIENKEMGCSGHRIKTRGKFSTCNA